MLISFLRARVNEGHFTKMMTVIVTVFEAAGLTVSEKKTETMLLRTPGQAPCASPLVIEAAGQRYTQTTQFLYLDGLVDASADNMPEIKRRVRLAWARYSQFKRELYDMEAASFDSEVAHAKGRGDGNSAVRVRNVDPRQGALR